MTPELPAELIDPPPRFSVRAVLIGMTVLAVAAACLAPVLRAWGPDRWWVVGNILPFYGLGIIVGWALNSWIRRRHIRRAGPSLIWGVRKESDRQLRQTSTIVLNSALGVLFGGVLLLAFVVLATSLGPDISDEKLSKVRQSSVFYGVIGAQVLLPLWCSMQRNSLRGVALGKGGVYVAADMKCHPWSVITLLGYLDGGATDELTIRVGGNFPKRVAVAVRAELRPAVETLLSECLPSQHD